MRIRQTTGITDWYSPIAACRPSGDHHLAVQLRTPPVQQNP
ncbi:hypothetical protein ACFXKW_31900 [Streptomyces sp. NPDC059193]